MRTLVAACVLTTGALAIGACHKPAAGGQAANPTAPPTAPARRPGVWEISATRDGGARPGGGKIQMCFDAATSARVSVLGQRLGAGACSREDMNRAADGSFHFSSTCSLGQAGTVTTNGVATGDFSTKYSVHSESDVSGATIPSMNGHHVADVQAVWLGPCPAGMHPGDVQLANGFKMNFNQPTGSNASPPQD